ncbi:MAG: isocitrate lyase/phosphoenolpyruvate mutase family protein [candidate division NC10 bacterium]|nr:isocitrate lyase/phosphoenolpyruvate mutase family protein [candidate division NC10 bacterium]
MDQTTERPTTRLRRLLQGPDILMAPGCFDPVSALLAEQAGFSALYLTGAGLASHVVGVPDIGLTTMSELLEAARRIVQVASVPAICDVDTGFGSAVNVIRTVREFESAGLAAIQLEDQVMPKKCGHTEGKQLVPKAEMVQKIRAAADTRRDPDFVLIARTDAIAVTGLEDALDRAHAYGEAGADVLFVEAPRTLEEMRRITREVPGIHLVNVVEGGGKTPVLRAKEYWELGYRLVIYPISAWTASIKAIQEVLAVLRADGTTDRYAERMVSFQEMFEVVGRSRYAALERKYAAREP